MKIHLITCWLFCLVFVVCVHAQQMPPVFPTPAAWKAGEGVFTAAVSVRMESRGKYAGRVRKEIKAFLRSCAGRPGFAEKGPKENTVVFIHDPASGLPDEAYTLEVTPRRITLVASSESGLFYAGQTLKQLIRAGRGVVPAGRFDDAPRMKWRGLMLDESRHFFGKDTVLRLLDRMAELKMNVFHWHLTDEPGWRIEIGAYPLLTTVGAAGNWSDSQAAPRFYTRRDIREIVAYAAERHILVVPEIDMPGHAVAACKAYPEVSGGGEGRWKGFTYHPCKQETYDFLGRVLTEVAELFPGPYIHIGGDEVHYGNQSWFTDPEIQAFIRANGLKNELGLEHYFLRRMADTVAAKGKTLIGWDEIADAGVKPGPNVVMWWRHDKPGQLKKALEAGFPVVLTPRRPLYFDFVQHASHRIGRRWNGFNPIDRVCAFPDTLQTLLDRHPGQVMGLQMSVWTERIADGKRLDFMIFPRIAAVAEAAWTPAERKNAGRFMEKLPVYLEYLESLGIYYFDPFRPEHHPEPWGPEKADVLQNG